MRTNWTESGSSRQPARHGRRLRRSLAWLFVEAVPARAAFDVSESFVLPLAIAFKATALQIGLLATLPQLTAALGQLLAPSAIDRLGSRRAVLQVCGVVGAAVWLAAVAVPALPSSMRIWALLVFAVLALILMNLPNPAWASWVSDLVPTTMRGRYLGARSMIASATSVAIFLVSGLFLDSLGDRVAWGFAAFYGVAAASRVSSALIFGRVIEPPVHAERGLRPPNFMRFLGALPQNNLGHFMLYSFALNFGVYLAGPFFTVYQLRDLGFGYSAYMLVSLASTVTTIVGLRIWGAYSDRHGNLRVVRICAFGVPLLPLLWLLVNDPLDAALISVVGGLSWAGLTLCSLNFVYECSTEGGRAPNVAYYYAIVGVAIFLGGTVGGALVGHLPAIDGSRLLTIFVLSGVTRLAATAFLPLVSEVRVPRPKARPNRASA